MARPDDQTTLAAPPEATRAEPSSAGPSARSGYGLSVIQRRDVEHEAHIASILRMRRAVVFSGILWLAFCLVDYFASRASEPAR